jgi:ribosomal protein L7/L12
MYNVIDGVVWCNKEPIGALTENGNFVVVKDDPRVAKFLVQVARERYVRLIEIEPLALFGIRLKWGDPDRKIAAIKALRAVTQWDLRTAKEFIESGNRNTVVVKGLTKQEAEALVRLEENEFVEFEVVALSGTD